MPLYPEIGTHLRETIQDEDTVTLIGSDMQSFEERYSRAMT